MKRLKNWLILLAVLACTAGRTLSAGAQETRPAVLEEAVVEEADRTAAVPEGLSYEVKFLLDPEQVLDGEHHLKKEWEQAFGITEEFVPYEVMYLETPEQDFRQEGWYNRFRRKSGNCLYAFHQDSFRLLTDCRFNKLPQSGNGILLCRAEKQQTTVRLARIKLCTAFALQAQVRKAQKVSEALLQLI